MDATVTELDSLHLGADDWDEPDCPHKWGTRRYAALALVSHMRDISEGTNCAGWLCRMEYDLWRMVLAGEPDWKGVTADDVVLLRVLARACGGWWVYRPDKGEVFVSLESWQRAYARWERRKTAEPAQVSA